MWFSSWLVKRQRGAASGPRHAPPRKRSSYRPRLEALEERWLPSQVGLTVRSLADSGPGTLRAAILTADAGSHSDKFTIGFAVTGTIDLQSPLPDLNNTIAVEGPGASSLVVVERAAGYSFTSAIVTVDLGQTVTLSGLTIANGNAGGVANNGGTLTVTNSAVSNNLGGGIAGFGSLTVSGSTVTGNSVSTLGGGIFTYFTGVGAFPQLTITASTVSGNTAVAEGGGIWAVANVSVSGSTISGNSAGASPFGSGGGIALEGGTLTVTSSTISGNSAGQFGGGGGLFLAGSFPSTISGSSVNGNTARNGGGIWTEGPLLTVSRSTVSGNSAIGEVFSGVPLPGAGGGIVNMGALTLSGCTLAGNSATGVDYGGNHYPGRGGGIMSFGSTTVRDSLFTANSADLGGGMYNFGNPIFFVATLDVRGCTFSGNTASDSGGGMYNLGTATVQASTLSGNTAGSDGGGIFNAASGTLAVKDSTVTNNVAPSGADIYNLGALALDDSTVGVIGP
jgi:hypothetical protein